MYWSSSQCSCERRTTFIEIKGTPYVLAADVFESLAGECMLDGKLHFPSRDDAGHHILHLAFHDVTQMQAPVDDIEAIFMEDQWRRVVEEGHLDIAPGQLYHRKFREHCGRV